MVNILVNSPDTEMARSLKESLEPNVYWVSAVQPGPMFLQAIRKERPDIVITDQVDKRSDAAEVEIAITKDLRPEARIIVVSGDSSEKDAKIIEQGIFYYLTSDLGSELARVVQAAKRSLDDKHRELPR